MKTSLALLIVVTATVTLVQAGDFAAAITKILKTHPKGYVFSVPLTNRQHCDLAINIAKQQGFKVTMVRTNGFLRITASK